MTSNGKYSMKVNAPSTLPFVFLLLFTGQLVADEYQSIFDGKSLAGWRAPNMSYWSVRDGAITAESTAANPCTASQFLVWQDGEVADFELKLKFRMEGEGANSGIQFRSVISPGGLGIGYQADRSRYGWPSGSSAWRLTISWASSSTSGNSRLSLSLTTHRQVCPGCPARGLDSSEKMCYNLHKWTL